MQKWKEPVISNQVMEGTERQYEKDDLIRKNITKSFGENTVLHGIDIIVIQEEFTWTT